MDISIVRGIAFKLSGILAKDVQIIKGLYGATYQKSTNAWYLPAFYPYGLESLKSLYDNKSSLGWEETEEIISHKDYLESTSHKISSNDIDGYVPVLKPYAHQLEALSYIIHTPRAGLFYDPGLGKTKIVCDLIRYLHSKNADVKVLVLALRVNLFTWVKEMSSNSDNCISMQAITSSTPKARYKAIDSAYEKSTGIVLTYDSAKVSEDKLQKLKFDLIVADESHSLRSPDSERTSSILRLLETNPIHRRVILSGTPSLGSPVHLWGQLKFLSNFLVGNQFEFKNQFLTFSPYNKHIVTGLKNISKLNNIVSSSSIRKKAEECLDLPDRTIQIIELDAPSKMSNIYNKIVNYLPVTINSETIPAAENAVTAMTRCAQITSGFLYKNNRNANICDSCPNMPKCVKDNIQPYTQRCEIVKVDPGRTILDINDSTIIDGVMELVESHMTDGSEDSPVKIILWAKHHEMLNRLYSEASSKYKVFRYDHTCISPKEVEEEFNTHTNSCIILAQISMGIGVTFKAPIMIYAELSFSLDHWLQSLDRNYGIRAKGFKSLLVQVVVIKDSLSHSTVALLNNKIDVSNLLSTKPNCITCSNVLACLQSNIQPFKDGCILPKDADKVSIPLKEI